MKRIYIFLSVIVVVILTANIYYYQNIYNQQVNFQKHILESQAEICGREIGNHLSDLMNEMNYILFSQDVAQFFQNRDVQENGIRKMGVFYLKYKNLLKGISLHDNQNNVFSLFKDEKDDLITDIYLSREQRKLLDTEKLEERSGETIFTIPVSGENGVIANIIVRADIPGYFRTVFTNYHIESTIWQCIINKDGKVFFSNKGPEVTGFSSIETIISDKSDTGGSIVHSIETFSGPLKVISSYYPVKVLDKDMVIVFSLNAGIVVSSFVNSILIIAVATFISLVLIILFFIYMVRNERREKHKSAESEFAMKAILELLPAGILIKRSDNTVKMINSQALNILKIDKPETVIGKDISDMFFLSGSFPVKSFDSGKAGKGEFVYYDDDESEVILYKTANPGILDNENVTVEVLVDISSMENARKNELLFCEAKTEFLRKISHDIRNPLNGILNMAGSLESEFDSRQFDKEKIKLIRECCDDIMSVVNDISDFPGYDSGSIVIDEIPFVLANEIGPLMDQLSEKAAETGVSIKYEISKTIPHKLIGDPEQLRQVLKTLTENSLKHTEKGEIKLSVDVKKQTGDIILLEFILEDTGTGISHDLIKKIKENKIDAELISTGKFGFKKTLELISLMKGDLEIESPLYTDKFNRGRGTRIHFSIEAGVFGLLQKKISFEEITTFKDIRVLVLSKQGESGSAIGKVFGKLGISCETTSFNDSTIDFIRTRMSDPGTRYSIIVIHDSEENDGFLISQTLVRHNLYLNFIIIFVGPVHKPGNFMKSRRLGVDHYLVEPFGGSEIYEIIQNHFSHIPAPSIQEKTLNKSMPRLEILVAEDNHINKMVAQSMFRNLGYEIDLASNGREAIDKIKVKDYDIVFMDIRMPLKNGLDAAYEIRRLGYTMPVVAMTANSGQNDKEQALQVGMDDFISKPVSIEVLRNMLQKRFSGHPD